MTLVSAPQQRQEAEESTGGTGAVEGVGVANAGTNVERLWREVQEMRDMAIAQRDIAARERDAVVVERDALRAEKNAVTAELDAVTAERDAARAERDTFKAERDTFRAERDTFRAERDTFRAERDTFRAERDTFKAEWDTVVAEQEMVDEERDIVRVELQTVGSELEATRLERDSLGAHLDAVTSEKALEAKGSLPDMEAFYALSQATKDKLKADVEAILDNCKARRFDDGPSVQDNLITPLADATRRAGLSVDDAWLGGDLDSFWNVAADPTNNFVWRILNLRWNYQLGAQCGKDGLRTGETWVNVMWFFMCYFVMM